ncbi:MAG: hypothetical protein H7039_15475 [Bryobacteraceae bacterium]|nr:hypothetical protein [Bryobacteraceae bacterium]
MPLQNRVDPRGAIIRSGARGNLMGNRGGVIHDEKQTIVRSFKGQRWITCLLDFKGRRRTVMTPGLYTELFFLDEAVALAAGHRPCAECRRERFNNFKEAWLRGASGEARVPLLAPEIDAELHRARVDSLGRKVTYQARLNTLPDGCFVQVGGLCFAVWNDALLLWSPEGYIEKSMRPGSLVVTVLTPAPTVHCIRLGYKPVLHESSLAL